VLQYRDTGGTRSWACHPQMDVREQTGGTFSGFMHVEGGSGDSGRHCSWESLFTAQVAPDGTITSFRPERDFGGGCTVLLSDASGSGTATSTTMQIKLMQHATCPDAFGQPRDTDRTLSIVVGRLPG
jgi:hypothetical protein